MATTVNFPFSDSIAGYVTDFDNHRDILDSRPLMVETLRLH